MSSRPLASCGAPRSKGGRPYVPRWGAWGVLCLLLILPPALAGPTEPASAVEALEREYAQALQELFWWCRGAHLNRTAEGLARELLEVDPDHEVARRWLRYKRRRGSWVPPKRPPKRTDRNRSAKERYLARRAEMLDVLVDRYWKAYERLEGDDHEAERRRIHAIAVDRWPRDARFRKAGGEVQRNGLWILRESARSDTVEKALQDQAQRLLEVVPAPADSTPPPLLAPFGLPWRGASRSGRIVVVSMTSPEEADRVAKHCTVAVKLFNLVFGVDAQLPADLTLALGRNPEDYQRALENMGVPEAERRRLENEFGRWVRELLCMFNASASEAVRLESAVRVTVNLLRERTFGDFGRLGWVREGFGTYLTWLVCGTRLASWRRMGAPTASDTGWGPSRELGDDWLAHARRLAVKGKLPELTYVVAVDHNAMTKSDLLAAYAFAVYLTTGWPGRLPRFLHVANSGKDTPDAAVEVLGLTLPRLEERFHRWLHECH